MFVSVLVRFLNVQRFDVKYGSYVALSNKHIHM